MKPLQTIYWLRLGLGATSAVLCAIYGYATGGIVSHDFQFATLMNSVSIALATYLISYYVIKAKFGTRVEKPTKLVTTGIGGYFFAWIVFWVLLYTLLAPV